uniref:hypothetical protein RF1 n=1 Tax=Hydnora arabica TaxID=2952646 RepID=UPI0021145A87|nr:hypothetical protein RF1 [Hydnora arabica]USN93630.1 hypothetical protein RF1 [Hydnora arabica]
MKLNTIYNIFTHILKNGKFVFKNYFYLNLLNYFLNNILIIFTGLFYGLTSLILIGPSYFVFIYFLTESKNIDEARFQALTGFFVGKLIIHLSTLYTPFYKLVVFDTRDRLIVFFFTFFLYYYFIRLINYKDYFKDNLSNTKIVFFTNLIIPFFNSFVIPNSALKRSMNFLLFKCENKKLFLTFDFIGSLIGYIIIFSFIEILSKKFVTKDQIWKYKYSYPIIFEKFFFFIYCVMFSRVPFIFSRKAYDLKLTELQDQIEYNKKITEEEKNERFNELENYAKIVKQKTLTKTLINYHGWYKPIRYVWKSFDKTENFVRNHMSQFFFNGSIENEKFNLFYTYSPNLYYFLKLINETFLFNFYNIYDDKNIITFDFYFKKRLYDQIISQTIENKIRFYKDIEIKNNQNKIVKIKNISLDLKDLKFSKNKDFSSFYFLFNRLKYFNKLFLEEKNVSRWIYNLFSEQQYIDFVLSTRPGIKNRKLKRLVLFKDLSQVKIKQKKGKGIESKIKKKKAKLKTKKQKTFYKNLTKKRFGIRKDKIKDVKFDYAYVHYPYMANFRRDLVRGSMRTKRRKISQLSRHLFQTLRSPLFSDINKINVLQVLYESFFKKKKKKVENFIEQFDLQGAKAWSTFPLIHTIRCSSLRFHSFIRKKIVFPLLIILKNIIRLLLMQSPEFYEDFNDLNNELHINCTFNGIQLSETEMPKNWWNEGMQIKILNPFKLRPWHTSKYNIRKPCFLTFFGKETDIPFGKPRKQSSFFKPIINYFYKELKKLIKFLKKTILNPILTLFKKIKLILIKLRPKKQLPEKKYNFNITHKRRMQIINKTIKIIQKKTSKLKLTSNTNPFKKLKFISKNKIKRINFLVKIIFENIIKFFQNKLYICLNRTNILLKIVKYYIKNKESKFIRQKKFKFHTINIKQKQISQAYIFYKLIDQETNPYRILFNCRTWKDFLKIEKLIFKNIFKLQSSNINLNLCKNYEYSSFVLNYLKKNNFSYFSNYHLEQKEKQKKLINYLINLDTIEKQIDPENFTKSYIYLKILENQKFKSLLFNESDDNNESKIKKNKIKTVEEDLFEKVFTTYNQDNIQKKEEKKSNNKSEKKKESIDEAEKHKKDIFKCLNELSNYQLRWGFTDQSKKLFTNIKFLFRIIRFKDDDSIDPNKKIIYTSPSEKILFKLSTLYFLIKKKEIESSYLSFLSKTITKFETLIDTNFLQFSVIPVNKHTSYNKYIYIQKLISIYFNLEKTFSESCFIPENYISMNYCTKMRTLLNLNSNLILSTISNLVFFELTVMKRNLHLYDDINSYNYNKLRKESCKFKKYIWPYFMFEDLACINRYWFNISNGSKFNILRLKQYFNK